MAERLFGIETEYALTALNARGEAVDRDCVLEKLMRLAGQKLPNLPDGAGAGMFLQNASRFYIDCPDHPEISTPEVTNPWDAVRYVQAGERIFTELAAELTRQMRGVAEVLLLRCNVDYGGTGNTWGCHESYLHRAPPALLPTNLIPHLVSRIIYSGAGGFNSSAKGLEFTLSPRAWHLVKGVSEHSTHTRGIFHTKDESLSRSGYHRLHILSGESLCSEAAMWLKVATTALVVALIEGGVLPGEKVQLRSPLDAMRRFASDPACRATAVVAGGRRMTAVAIQRHYLDQAEAHVGAAFMPPWAAEACSRWRDILDRLEGGPASVATELDWAIKLVLFKDRARRRGIAWESVPFWNHIVGVLADAIGRPECPEKHMSVEAVLADRSPVAGTVASLTPYLRTRQLDWSGLRPFVEFRLELFEIDARFGQLGEKGIFAELDRAGVLRHHVAGVDNIEHAMEHPPETGRARLRGEQVRQLSGNRHRYVCGWGGVWDGKDKRSLDLSDPFAADAEWRAWTPGDDPLSTELIRLAEVIPSRRGESRLRSPCFDLQGDGIISEP